MGGASVNWEGLVLPLWESHVLYDYEQKTDLRNDNLIQAFGVLVKKSCKEGSTQLSSGNWLLLDPESTQVL